jgi:hypothetical protein
MKDLLQQEISPPVTVTIGGNSYLLTYGMAAVIVYKAETARIERSRPQPVEKDPLCLCGERKSRHTGLSLIILGEQEDLVCWGFRLYDAVQGDSLLTAGSWKRIDLDLDPERWLACLWAGLHRLSDDGKNWEAPMSLASLGSMIPVGSGARALSLKMVEALKYSSDQTKKKPDPNAEAAADETTAAANQAPPENAPSPTSIGSTLAPVVASVSAGPSS